MSGPETQPQRGPEKEARSRAPLALSFGAGLVAAAVSQLELVSYRLNAAVLGNDHALLGAVVAPAAGAVGAAFLASRSPLAARGKLAALAGYGASVAASGCAASAILLTWISQLLGRSDTASWLVWLPLVAWAVAMFGAAGSLGLALRAVGQGIGRLCFAIALGAALGSLTVTPTMAALGAPRTLLAIGLTFAASALVLAAAASPAGARRDVMTTVVLALSVLILGDLGNPWMRVKADFGRRGRVGHSEWTADGLVAIDKLEQSRVAFTIDKSDPEPFAARRGGAVNGDKPPFEPTDLVYSLHPEVRGAALVIASGGGRDVKSALAREQDVVDVIEPSGALVRLLGRRFASEAGWLLQRPERVTVRVGDPSAQIQSLRASYQRIVVAGAVDLQPAAPRQMAASERLFSVEAVHRYLERLDPEHGTLALRVDKEALPDLIATAARATGGLEALAERSVACVERKDEGVAVLLASHRPIDGPARNRLGRACKRKGMTVEFPVEEVRAGTRNREERERERDAQLEAFANGAVITDDRPFAEVPPSFAGLRAAARDSLRAIALLTDEAARHRKPAAADDVEAPPATEAGVTTAASGLALIFALLALAVPIPRGGNRSPRVALRVAVSLLGVAAALASFATSDHLLRWLGGSGFAWAVVVPIGALGIGSGQLASDVVSDRKQLALGLITAILGAALFVAAGSYAPGLAGVSALGLVARVAVAVAVLLGAGVCLGAPLAAAMRIGRRDTSSAVGWAWGVHLSGWALGGGVALIAVRYLGVSQLFVVAAAVLALAALLLFLGRARA